MDQLSLKEVLWSWESITDLKIGSWRYAVRRSWCCCSIIPKYRPWKECMSRSSFARRMSLKALSRSLTSWCGMTGGKSSVGLLLESRSGWIFVIPSTTQTHSLPTARTILFCWVSSIMPSYLLWTHRPWLAMKRMMLSWDTHHRPHVLTSSAPSCSSSWIWADSKGPSMSMSSHRMRARRSNSSRCCERTRSLDCSFRNVILTCWLIRLITATRIHHQSWGICATGSSRELMKSNISTLCVMSQAQISPITTHRFDSFGHLLFILAMRFCW